MFVYFLCPFRIMLCIVLVRVPTFATKLTNVSLHVIAMCIVVGKASLLSADNLLVQVLHVSLTERELVGASLCGMLFQLRSIVVAQSACLGRLLKV